MILRIIIIWRGGNYVLTQARRVAEEATLTGFLNCYLRETGEGQWRSADRSHGTDEAQRGHQAREQGEKLEQLRIALPRLSMTLRADAAYRSPTGRHRFVLPAYIEAENNEPVPIEGLTCIALLLQSISMTALADKGNEAAVSGVVTAELLSRIIQSCGVLEETIRVRQQDISRLYDRDLAFIEAEQALLFGHAFHPSPKSRQGFPEWRMDRYSPEVKGSFRLHYFALHRRIVTEDSAWPNRASEITHGELLDSIREAGESTDNPHTARLLQACLQSGEFAFVPVHPVQADWLLHEPCVQRWLMSGEAVSLGEIGREYRPTSSIRTVYHPESRYMYKFSLRVKITNSLRVNKRKELVGALEASRLMARIQPRLEAAYPRFHVLAEAAWIAAGDSADAEESGFELIVRENPFRGALAERTFVIAALTQDPLPGCASLLAGIVSSRSAEEGRSPMQISLDWFRRYLALSLEPLLWLYDEYGIALEAHQQNGVVQLDEQGYPERFYYRDSQGYYYAASMCSELEKLLPGIGSSVNAFDDRIVEERFGYYLIVNHLCGVIQAFGGAGCADERVLLAELHAVLEACGSRAAAPHSDRFIRALLTEPSCRVKANLLTRLYDIDELERELEQAVYAEMPNPLLTELPRAESIRKARAITLHWRRERAYEWPTGARR
jgi:spermidine-citrate ligase